ncbi:MAG: FtsW/RodA/SpoVE family cell cycle protein, partial [Clostridiales bacterium]|nr:FtsW/RodA/SpoVE family cell cycle protein [Clostridiales bacterium]
MMMHTDGDIEKLIDPGRPMPEVRPDGTKAMPARKYQTNIPMIIMLAIMVVFGFIVLYSVSGPDAYGQFQDSAYFLKRQLAFTVAGIAGCLIVAFIPINFFKQKVIMLGAYGLSFALALITLAMGQGGQQHGASRWITIGGIQFQSSELIKVALVIAFAGYRAFIDEQHRKGRLKAKNPGKQMLLDATFDFIVPVVSVIVVDLVILLEPHLSCFIIIAGVIFMCALSSEIPLKSWITGGLIT